MATEPHIAHWVNVVWNMRRSGNRQQYTFNYRTDPDVGIGIVLEDLSQALWTRSVGLWPQLHSTGVTLNNISAKTMYPQSTNFEGSYTPTSPLAGTVAGDMAPGHVALAVQYDSGLRGRRTHGRQFMGGMAEATSVGDFVTSAFMTSLADWVGAMLQNVLIDDYVFMPVVASRKDLALYSITRALWDNVVDSQRRRLTGRGE